MLLGLASRTLAGPRAVRWRHLSTKTGDLQPPNAGDQQTSAAVADFDGDHVNDFVVTERTKAPSVVLYRRAKTGWDRFVVGDFDGDGMLDLVGGGRWFRHEGGTRYAANVIDASYQPTRAATGQIVEGGRPEVVLTVGDGWAPPMLHEWQKGAWVPKVVLPEVDCTHPIRLVDFDRDGHLDIWVAEMRLNGENPDAKNQILFGDGRGGFEPITILEGFGLHESEIADLDGDGDLDVLGKPYNWEAPRLDVWMNEGPAE